LAARPWALPEDRLHREQRDMATGEAIDQDEIATPKISIRVTYMGCGRAVFLECSQAARGPRQWRSRLNHAPCGPIASGIQDK